MAAPLSHTMLALTLEQYPEELQMEKVPPHITVLPWFGLQDSRIDYILNTTCEQTNPITVSPGEQGEVGSNGHIKKALFLESPELRALHKRLFGRLGDVGVRFPYPEWLNENYNPHIRIKDSEAEIPECGLVFSSLAVIRNGAFTSDGIAYKTITNINFKTSNLCNTLF